MYPRTHTTSLSALSPHWEALHRFGQNQPNILQFARESNRWAGRQDATAHMVDGIHHGCQSPRAPSKSAIHPTHGTVAAPPHRQLPPTHHFANTAPVYLSCLKKKRKQKQNSQNVQFTSPASALRLSVNMLATAQHKAFNYTHLVVAPPTPLA